MNVKATQRHKECKIFIHVLLHERIKTTWSNIERSRSSHSKNRSRGARSFQENFNRYATKFLLKYYSASMPNADGRAVRWFCAARLFANNPLTIRDTVSIT